MRQVYYVVDAQQRVPLVTPHPHVPLHDSYRRFKSGLSSTAGYANYKAYLEQLLPMLQTHQASHFIITDGHYYGFQELVEDHRELTSQGSWAHEKERDKVIYGIDWVMVERQNSQLQASRGHYARVPSVSMSSKLQAFAY